MRLSPKSLIISLRSGRAEPFRTVPVGLWADPVVTRKFHVASRRINNLRELSGEQAAEPRFFHTFVGLGWDRPPLWDSKM
jgi:hypothetical protein